MAFNMGGQAMMDFGSMLAQKKKADAGGVVGGAAKGAMKGAAAGGPVGAVVGGAVNLLGGLLSLKSKKEEERRKKELDSAQLRAGAVQRGQTALTSGQQAAFQQMLGGARGALL